MNSETKTFSEMEMHEQLKSSIKELGFDSPTPIQQRCFPIITQNRDVAGLAQTGTGKTGAYLMPLIHRVLSSMSEEPMKDAFQPWTDKNFILVLVPTRELVTQVCENFAAFTSGTNLNIVSIYGGVSYEKQIEGLKKPFQFVAATPGRLIDLYKESHIDLKQARALVFDEADRMFDMGFQDDVKYILQRAPDERQLLMFSATLNLNVTQMAYEAHSDPIEVDMSRDKMTADNVSDQISHVGQNEKPQFLLSLFKKHNPKQVIIFSNFKAKIQRIADFLNNNGYSALGISSLLSQKQRNAVMEKFKGENAHNILVATDVAARGLDVEGVDMVVNFELPDDAENYVHRIGRTGRADSTGMAFSFVSDRDVDSLVRIEDYLNRKVDVLWLEDDELIKDFKAFPEEFRPRRPQQRDFKGRKNKSFDKDKPKPRRKPVNKRKGPGSESEEAEGAPVHRDKRTGRHKKKSTHRTGAKSSKSSKSTQPKNRKPQNRKQQKRRVKNSEPKGFFATVTRTISSLFGSSKNK